MSARHLVYYLFQTPSIPPTNTHSTHTSTHTHLNTHTSTHTPQHTPLFLHEHTLYQLTRFDSKGSNALRRNGERECVCGGGGSRGGSGSMRARCRTQTSLSMHQSNLSFQSYHRVSDAFKKRLFDHMSLFELLIAVKKSAYACPCVTKHKKSGDTSLLIL